MGPSGWSWGPWSWLGSFASHPLPDASRPGVSCSFCAKCLLSPDLLAPQEALEKTQVTAPSVAAVYFSPCQTEGEGAMQSASAALIAGAALKNCRLCFLPC